MEQMTAAVLCSVLLATVVGLSVFAGNPKNLNVRVFFVCVFQRMALDFENTLFHKY